MQMAINYLDRRSIYAITIDSKICGFVRCEAIAKNYLNLLLDRMLDIYRKEKPGKQFFTEVEGTTTKVFGMRPGQFWNGRVTHVSTLSYFNVKKMEYVKEMSETEKLYEEEDSDDEYSTYNDYECAEDEEQYLLDESSNDEEEQNNVLINRRIPLLYPPPPKFIRYMMEPEDE